MTLSSAPKESDLLDGIMKGGTANLVTIGLLGSFSESFDEALSSAGSI